MVANLLEGIRARGGEARGGAAGRQAFAMQIAQSFTERRAGMRCASLIVYYRLFSNAARALALSAVAAWIPGRTGKSPVVTRLFARRAVAPHAVSHFS
jgi:hypothetical protein